MGDGMATHETPGKLVLGGVLGVIGVVACLSLLVQILQMVWAFTSPFIYHRGGWEHLDIPYIPVHLILDLIPLTLFLGAAYHLTCLGYEYLKNIDTRETVSFRLRHMGGSLIWVGLFCLFIRPLIEAIAFHHSWAFKFHLHSEGVSWLFFGVILLIVAYALSDRKPEQKDPSGDSQAD